MARRQSKPTNLRVAHTLGNRDETTTKDGKLQNGFAEKDGSLLRAVKRPGMTSRYTLGTGQAGATIGQMLFAFQTPSAPGIAGTSTLIAVRGDTLTRPVT